MNIQEMHEWYNVIIDSYNEPYFTESEIDLFINNGQDQFVKDIIAPEHTPVVDQNDTGRQLISKTGGSSQTYQAISTLIFDVIVTNQAISIPFSAIDESLINKVLSVTGYNESDAQTIHIQSVDQIEEDGSRTPVRFVRASDLPRFNANIFKRQSLTSPVYTYKNGGIVVRPLVITDYEINVIKRPRRVSIENDISTDLPIISHLDIISYAIAASGVASRDDIMLQLQKMSGNGTDRQ